MLQIANAETGETEKMSKSLNNFLLLHEVLEQVRPAALRMLMLQSHYRSPLVFGEQRVAEADAALTRIENAVKALDWLLETGTPRGEAALEPETAAEVLAATLDAAALSDRVAVLRDGFTEAMDDDFNAPAALGEIFSFVSDVNALVADAKTLAAEEAASVREARDAIVELMDVLGIDVTAAEVGRPTPWKWWRSRPIWLATTATTRRSPWRACSRPVRRPAKRRTGPWPTASATAWPTSAL